MKVVTVARRPCQLSVVTLNVVQFQAGALDIDATRIGVGDGDAREEEKSRDLRYPKHGSKDFHALPGPRGGDARGRWPANVILQHQRSCVRDGTTVEAGYVINRWKDGAKPFGGGAGHEYEGETLPPQQIEQWRCVSSCAVLALGEQSGVTKSGDLRGYERRNTGGFTGPLSKIATTLHTGDAGTAARFFKQVQSMDNRIPSDLLEYLVMLISPPPSCTPLVIAETDLAQVDFSQYESGTVHGLLTVGDPTPWLSEVHRVLRPGAHVLLLSDDNDPTGSTGACAIEDFGYEIRDAIAVLDTADEFTYSAKPSSRERHEGVISRDRITKELRLFPREGEDLGALREELAESVDGALLKRIEIDGLPLDEVPEDTLDSFEQREVEMRRELRNDHPCLHPDDLVMTARGFRPLTEIQPGDLVYTQDGDFRTVEEVSRHPYTSSCLYEVHVIGTNYTTRASDNHPFLIWRPRRERNNIVGGEVGWRLASELRRGDYTMTPLMAEDPMVLDATPTWADYIDDDEFWFLLGLYIAEGCVHSGNGGKIVYPSYSLGAHEEHLHRRIESYFAPKNTGIYKKGEGGVQVVPFDFHLGRLFLDLAGHGAASKGIDPSIWKAPLAAREALFEGYMAGDGCRVRLHRQCKTVSQDLASQLWLLAEGLGHKTNLFRYPGTPGGIGDREFKRVLPEHQVTFYSRNQSLVHRKPVRPTYVEHEGQRYTLRYVKKIVEVPYCGDVMNLSVAGSPTFLTPVGITHNTVKSVGLMMALLEGTPVGGLVVDPFHGSGTTGVACVRAGYDFVGIELERDYLTITDQRVRHWDRREVAWDGAVIESEALPFEHETKLLDDVFDLMGES
jgi:intein/homing endonuclease